MSAQKPASCLGLFSISYSKLALDLHIRFRNSSLNLIKVKTEMWVKKSHSLHSMYIEVVQGYEIWTNLRLVGNTEKINLACKVRYF